MRPSRPQSITCELLFLYLIWLHQSHMRGKWICINICLATIQLDVCVFGSEFMLMYIWAFKFGRKRFNMEMCDFNCGKILNQPRNLPKKHDLIRWILIFNVESWAKDSESNSNNGRRLTFNNGGGNKTTHFVLNDR